MITNVDARSAQFLANLKQIHERQARVQQQISSGIRVSRSSDDPGQVMNILQLRSEVERAGAIGANLSRATAEVDTADAALHVMVEIMERARVLAAQTATGTAGNRPEVALEARQLHEQLVNLTRTMSDGRYVFSGDRDTEVLYTSDWTQDGGVSHVDATNTRMVEDINGTRFSIARSAGEILDPRDSGGAPLSTNSFKALYDLTIALENDDQAGVQQAAARISECTDHLGRQIIFYGHVQNRLRDATNLNASALIARKTELGEAQDTDLPDALIELNLAGVHLQAALGAQAQLPRQSLFDFIG
jgi:flagellar hook-associated protein 3 FlgL